MKRTISVLLVVVVSFLNAFAFVGCSEASAKTEEVRACWVSSVGNMDFPSKCGLSSESLMAEIDAIVNNCKRMGLNTIFFQVRPMGDALYDSEVFPWSAYLSGKQGVAPEGEFDPLTYFVRRAHDLNLRLHAWVNPYRIGSGSDVWGQLSADNPAIQFKECTVTCDSGVYYNPGHPKSRELILRGVSELVRNYDIDGIHFDDYFYPYNMDGFDDSAVFAKYGGGMTLEDFRRVSVDELVKVAYVTIKTLDENVEFGISPFGIWANKSDDPSGSDTNGMSSYSAIYSDSKKWVEEGWVDYICPQIYWSAQHDAASYSVLVDWWDSVCSVNNIPLYVGIAAYKVGSNEVGWDSGAVMKSQLKYASEKKSYAGHSFFRYGILIQNPLGALDSIRSYYGLKKQELVQNSGEEKIEVERPQLQLPAELKVSSPQNGALIYGSSVSVSGITTPGASVTVNGVNAKVSEKGFFSAYVSLRSGQNAISVRSGRSEKRIVVTRKTNSENLTQLDFESAYPKGEVIRNAGDCIEFAIMGPKESKIQLKNDQISIELSASPNDPNVYCGNWTVPSFPGGDKLVLDSFRYEGVVNGKPINEDANLSLQIYATGYSEEKILRQQAYIFDKSSGGSQMDHDPLREGAIVRVVGREGERDLLDNGYWINRDTLGNEQIVSESTGTYDYDVITVSAKNSFGYSTEFSNGSLLVYLSAGINTDFDFETEQADLLYSLKQFSSESVLEIKYRSGRDIVGYEILPGKDGMKIYVRYFSNDLSGKRVLLDAGHGGKDSGASGPGGVDFPSESDLNLLLTDAIKKELEAKGATVLLTRKNNSEITLQRRIELSSLYSPDLFISVHHNSVDYTADYNSASGGLVLYSSPLSRSLADCIADTLWNGIASVEEVPVKRQSLYVCRQTRCPAVLIEAGYVCNPLEYEMLCSEDNAKRIAKNIVSGLEEYFVTVCS